MLDSLRETRFSCSLFLCIHSKKAGPLCWRYCFMQLYSKWHFLFIFFVSPISLCQTFANTNWHKFTIKYKTDKWCICTKGRCHSCIFYWRKKLFRWVRRTDNPGIVRRFCNTSIENKRQWKGTHCVTAQLVTQMFYSKT